MKKSLTFKSTLSRVGLCYFTLMLITQVLQLVLSVLCMDLIASGGWWVWIISYVPLYCVAVPIFLLMMHKLMPNAPKTFGTAELKFSHQMRWIILCLGTTYVFNIVSVGITLLIGMLKGGEVINPLQNVVEASSPLATLLFACVLAPVGEEFLFRKLLYDKIGRYGTRVYVLVGGFIFSLFHANLSQLLYAFVLGMMFCYIYAYTGKLSYTIALHICINIVGSMALPMLAATGETGTAIVGLVALILMVAGVVIAIRKRWRFAPETAPQAVEETAALEDLDEAAASGTLAMEDGQSAKRAEKDVPHTFGGALRTPGMIAYVVLCVLLIAVVTFMA